MIREAAMLYVKEGLEGNSKRHSAGRSRLSRA